MILTVALAVLAFLSCWYLLFIGLLLVGLSCLRNSGAPAGERYTVLIAARNEERRIRRCVESVLNQTMTPRRYDVVVVDDRSDDRTPDILREMAADEPRLTVVTVGELPDGISPKKHALRQGLQAVGNSVVACTDADCVVPRTWLDTIDTCFGEHTGLVQGITSYRVVDGMNRGLFVFQSLDFLSHGIVSAASIGAGLPLNANGNNIAWRRAAFDDVGGYGESGKVLLGDDDLLMQRIHRHPKWRVRFMADRRGAVTTEPETTLGGMLRQRARWGSVSVHYGVCRVALLAGVFLFFCGIPAALALGILDPLFLLVGAGMLAVKMAGELAAMVVGGMRFGQTRLLGWTPVISLPHLLLVLIAAFTGVFGAHEWKGQRSAGSV